MKCQSDPRLTSTVKTKISVLPSIYLQCRKAPLYAKRTFGAARSAYRASRYRISQAGGPGYPHPLWSVAHHHDNAPLYGERLPTNALCKSEAFWGKPLQRPISRVAGASWVPGQCSPRVSWRVTMTAKAARAHLNGGQRKQEQHHHCAGIVDIQRMRPPPMVHSNNV